MVIVLTVSVLAILVGAAFIWYLSVGAPEGYENESGFHYAEKSAVAVKKPAKESVPAPLETRNDHEPLAA